MSAQTNLYSSFWFKNYTSLGSDVDLLADGPDPVHKRVPCRRIVPGSTGNLVVVQMDGTSRTLPVTSGETVDVQAKTITASGTTVTAAKVYW